MPDSNNNKKEWKNYEELIYSIYKELEPFADVKLNDSILGIESNTKREIDISIRSKIATHEILIIVQGKHHKKRADLKIIGEFASVIRDLRASKGILICSAGFTKSAKEYASKLKIDLYTAHDASNKNWQTEIQIPVIKKSIKVDLKIQHHYVAIGETSMDHIKVPYPELAFSIFMEKWEKDEISKEPGTHYLPLEKEAVQLHKDLLPLKTGVEYKVTNRHHFKFFVPVDYRGLKDYITENFTPSFMAFNEQIPFMNDGTWVFVENPDDLPLKTLHLNIEILAMGFLKKKMIRLKWEK